MLFIVFNTLVLFTHTFTYYYFIHISYIFLPLCHYIYIYANVLFSTFCLIMTEERSKRREFLPLVFVFFSPFFIFSRKQPLLTFFENNCHLIYACKEGILPEQKIKTTSWLMVHRVSFGPGPKPCKRKATLK